MVSVHTGAQISFLKPHDVCCANNVLPSADSIDRKCKTDDVLSIVKEITVCLRLEGDGGSSASKDIKNSR